MHTTEAQFSHAATGSPIATRSPIELSNSADAYS